jgi:hypothetical protein
MSSRRLDESTRAAASLAALLMAACGDHPGTHEAAEATFTRTESGLRGPRALQVEYIDCDEFAGVGVVSVASVAPLVPDDYTIVDVGGGQAPFVAQAGRCREIRVNGRRGRPGIFAQVGVSVAPPLTPGQGDFYQLAFATTSARLAARLRALGVNARFAPRLAYRISAGDVLTIDVPRPRPYAFRIEGPIVRPDPEAPPNPLTVFNYYAQSRRAGNILQENAVSGIRFGQGPGVRLVARGRRLRSIVGSAPFAFPFFSAPEVFDRVELDVQPRAF